MTSVPTREEKTSFMGPEGSLEGFIRLGETNPNIIGVICHPHPAHQGSMNNKVVTTIAKAWQELGISTVRFNFRGVGESQGISGEGPGEIEDLKAVLTQLQQRYPDAHFWLGGFSFGSLIALSVTVQNRFPIKALLNIAPPVHYFDIKQLQELPHCPWLIIQGSLDTIVPVNEVLLWVEGLQKKQSQQSQNTIELEIMPNAEHFFDGQLIELKAIIVEKMKAWI
jgi:alpha/beta superfamily hydrolase